MKTSARVLLAFALMASVRAAEPKVQGPDSRAAFEKLKSLAGSWRGHLDKKDNSASVNYRVVAGGSVVMETIFPGTPQETVSMYYLDGGKLWLTHYSNVGNQPEMIYDQKHSKPDELVFEFDGGRGFVAREDEHVHNAAIKITDSTHLQSMWTSWNLGKESGLHHFVLTRQSR